MADTALLRTMAVSWVAAFAVLSTAAVPEVLFGAAALFGMANGVLIPVITVLIGDTPPRQRRGQATAMFTGQFHRRRCSARS